MDKSTYYAGDGSDGSDESESHSSSDDEGCRPTTESAANESVFFDLTKSIYRLYACEDHSDANCTADFRLMDRLSNSTHEKVVQRMVSLGIVELFQHVWLRHFDDQFSTKPLSNRSVESKPSRLWDNLFFVLNTVVNLTDASVSACQRVLDVDLHKTILKFLSCLALNSNKETKFTYEQFMTADCLMTVLYNVIQVLPEARMLYREEKALDVLQRFRTNTNFSISCVALILQAYVINEEEFQILCSNEETFLFLVTMLDGALATMDHRSSYGYKATELAVAVNKLAVNDKNQAKIINSGVVESYVGMLGVGNSNEEQLVAVQGLWTLSFISVEFVRKQVGCTEGLFTIEFLFMLSVVHIT